jgi:hypothetical protein
MALNMSLGIKAAVGAPPGAANNRQDVENVQTLLNEHAARVGYPKLPVNGTVTPQMIEAIKKFQQKAIGMKHPDGRVDPSGTTLKKLNEPAGAPSPAPSPSGTSKYPDVFSHPDADKVKLEYGPHAVKLNDKAEYLLKSIVASVGMKKATLNSTLRTYNDQARITLNETYPSSEGPTRVPEWYGQEVLDACKKYKGDIDGLATWWEEHDKKQGKVSSRHLSNQAMDVVPDGDRKVFAARVEELVKQSGSGVRRIIPKGQLHEPVDHVEFHFKVTG